MPSRPTYRVKANPSDAPIMILTLTGELVARANCMISPLPNWRKPSRKFDGVGDADVGGSSPPAVRRLKPAGASTRRLRWMRSAKRSRLLTYADRKVPEDSVHRWQIQTNDELKTAAEYQPLDSL